MKISLVYDAIYPYIKGGGEKRYYEIAQRLSAKGHEVHIYGQKLWSGDKIIKKEGIFYHGIAKSSSLYTQERKRSIKEAIMFGFCSLKMVKEDFDIKTESYGAPASLFRIYYAINFQNRTAFKINAEL